MTEVITEIIALVTVLATGGVAFWKVRLEQKKAELAEQEMQLQSDTLSFAAFLADWNDVAKEMSHLIATSEIDRILVLKAWNGSLDPKWTTAVYQMRDVGQEPRQYIHFELDPDYVDRLRQIVSRHSIAFTVAKIADSFIKRVYDGEGVRSSYWAHIASQSIPGRNAVAINYASFSSHSADEISEDTQTRCMLIVNRLKGLAATFKSEE